MLITRTGDHPTPLTVSLHKIIYSGFSALLVLYHCIFSPPLALLAIAITNIIAFVPLLLLRRLPILLLIVLGYYYTFVQKHQWNWKGSFDDPLSNEIYIIIYPLALWITC